MSSNKNIKYGYLHASPTKAMDGWTGHPETVDDQPDDANHKAKWYVYCGKWAGYHEVFDKKHGLEIAAMPVKARDEWAWEQHQSDMIEETNRLCGVARRGISCVVL